MQGAIRLAVLLAIAVGWCLFLTPVHIAVTHGAGLSVQLRVDGSEVKFADYPVAVSHRVTITNITDDTGVVELALPVPDGRPRLAFGDLVSVAGDWKSTARGERVESAQAGSEITLDLSGAAPVIPLLHRPDGGRVRIRCEGHEEVVDLRAERIGWRNATLPPRRVVSVATLRGNPFGTTFDVRASGTVDGSAVGEVRIGAKPAIRSFDLSATPALSVALPAGEFLSRVFEGIGHFARTLGLAALFILAFVLAGAPLATGKTGGAGGRSRWVGSFAIGFALFALIANSTAYFFPASASAPFLGAILFAAIAIGSVVAFRSVRTGSGEPPGGLPLVVVAATALGVWLSFWPLSFVGPGYLGGLQMDSTFYATASNAIQGKSLFAAMADEGVIGNGMRSIDLALAASLSSITGLGTGQVWLVMCMALLIVPPLASYYLVRDWLGNQRVAIVSSVSVALSAPIASLYVESYLVQYVTTAALYLNLYTALPFMRSLAGSKVSLRTNFAHATSSAFTVLLYPYFAIVPLATAGIAAWTLRRDRRRLVRHVGLLAATGLLVGNVGYLFMLNHGATAQFVDELNEIARYVVFPFFDRPKFLSFLFGLAPFHASAELLRSLITETGASPVTRGLALYLSLVERRLVYLALLLIAAAYLMALAARRRLLLDGFGLVLPVSLVGYLIMLLLAWHTSGLYATCKLAWTLATLFPVIITPVIAAYLFSPSGVAAGERRRDLPRRLAAGALILFLGGNLISRAAGPVYWFANPGTFWKANTAVAADLATFAAWLDAHARRGARFAFVEPTVRTLPPEQPLRILAGHVYSSLVSKGNACINCNLSGKLLEFMWFEPVDTGAIDVDLLVMIGSRPQAGVPGWSPAMEGEKLTVYVRPLR